MIGEKSVLLVALVSYQFDFDPTNGIVRCRFEGSVTDEEIKNYYRDSARVYASTDGLVSALTDFSSVTSFDVSGQTMLDLASSTPALPDPEKVRVIVAPTPVAYGLSRMFEIAGERTRPNLHVVKTEREAWAILGVWEPKFEPLQQ
ncbi:MAG TPA: hypothetical protein VE077_20625 [Candidatus Methylomirabilis sp.]|nr:hypothetical protein [Candidatus Methylomirabilis sp.]